MSSNSNDDNNGGMDKPTNDVGRTNPTAAQLNKRELLAAVGHELRTPLHAVTGMLDLLWNTAMDAEQRGFLADARQNTATLVRIVGDALDYATLAAGEMSLAPEPTSVRAIVDAAAAEHAEVADARGLELIVDVDIAMPERVLVDSARVQQVLSHLIETAVQVTKSGHVLVQVYLNQSEVESTDPAAPQSTPLLSINVLDSQSNENTSHKVRSERDPNMSRTKPPVTPGLSLALCIELVNRMHGRLEVYAQPSGGSCATCLVPAVIPTEAAEANTTDNDLNILKASHGFELVVYDEHPCTRQSLSEMARSLGVDVITASDPNDLLDIVSLPTLGVQRAVLLGNGHSLVGTRRALQQIRALRNAKDIPVAIAAPPSLVSEAKDTLAVPVGLSKPVAFADLKVAISQLSRNVLARQNPALATGYAQEALTGLVLVVDDMPTNLKIACSMLRRIGMTVETCGSGPEAIRLLEHKRFDLVFMDIQMPGMDGHETTQAIRRLPSASAGAPIVALTANSASEGLQSARDSGMDDFVVKPARAIRLREITSRWLRAADALIEYPADVPGLLDQDASDFGNLIKQQRTLESLLKLEDYESLSLRATELGNHARAAGARALARLAELAADACRFADFESAERYVGAMRRLEQPHDCAAACG